MEWICPSFLVRHPKFIEHGSRQEGGGKKYILQSLSSSGLFGFVITKCFLQPDSYDNPPLEGNLSFE
jgi:hypothetical protein